MKNLVAACLVLVSSVACAQDATTTVDFGKLILHISTARTAQVFSIVDQLSQWDVYAHKQYARWAGKALRITDQDRALLAQHAELRRKRGWGKGFEQAFLVDDSIDHAAQAAVSDGTLTADEANAERVILEHFALIVQPLMDESAPQLDALILKVVNDRARLAPLVDNLAQFAETKKPVTASVFLVSNPDVRSGGGGANGGRIVVEVPGPDPEAVLLHEALHHLLKGRAADIEAAARAANVPFTTLNEGIAYALSPGLTDDEEREDRLASTLVRFELRGTRPGDVYLQSNMMAIIIRPLLRAAVAHGETLTDFLPEAVKRWRSISGE